MHTISETQQFNTVKPRKNVLKNSNKSGRMTRNGIKQINDNTKESNCIELLELLSSIPRPRKEIFNYILSTTIRNRIIFLYIFFR
jgi:hypothetical protein